MMKTLYYLSFARDGFLGACVVESEDFIGAVMEASLRGCNPGGEVKGLRIPAGSKSPFPLNTLMSREDMERISGEPTVKWDENV